MAVFYNGQSAASTSFEPGAELNLLWTSLCSEFCFDFSEKASSFHAFSS